MLENNFQVACKGLSEEVWLLIFSNLDIHDLARVSRVCQWFLIIVKPELCKRRSQFFQKILSDSQQPYLARALSQNLAFQKYLKRAIDMFNAEVLTDDKENVNSLALV